MCSLLWAVVGAIDALLHANKVVGATWVAMKTGLIVCRLGGTKRREEKRSWEPPEAETSIGATCLVVKYHEEEEEDIHVGRRDFKVASKLGLMFQLAILLAIQMLVCRFQNVNKYL